MESEEFEQIPWANLVSEQTEGIDKRVYLAVGVIGVLVIVVFGMRLLGGGSQPTPPPQAAAPVQTTAGVAQADAAPSTSLIIAEADLRAESPIDADQDRLAEFTAEWFVTDWFTRDGSDETIRSIKASLAPNFAPGPLPHEIEQPTTFVEWAKAFRTETLTGGRAEIAVAYRTIKETENGFVREPVRTVIVSLVRTGDAVLVTALPLATDG